MYGYDADGVLKCVRFFVYSFFSFLFFGVCLFFDHEVNDYQTEIGFDRKMLVCENVLNERSM